MKPLNRSLAIVLPLVSSLFGAFSHAAESDIAEALELKDATPLSQLEILYESKAKLQTAEANEEKASFVRRLRGGVAGENRLLFEVKFDHPPVMDRSSFCLYLDLDNNLNTGREDEGAKGVDLMVAMDTTKKGTYLQFRNPSLTASNTKMRAVWDGTQLYITIETPLPKQPAAIRAYFLSSKDKGASNSATPTETLMEANPSKTKLPPLP